MHTVPTCTTVEAGVLGHNLRTESETDCAPKHAFAEQANMLLDVFEEPANKRVSETLCSAQHAYLDIRPTHSFKQNGVSTMNDSRLAQPHGQSVTQFSLHDMCIDQVTV